jgi:hypothetical protein
MSRLLQRHSYVNIVSSCGTIETADIFHVLIPFVDCDGLRVASTIHAVFIVTRSFNISISDECKKETLKSKLNSVAWIRERTIPIERPPLVGEVSASFLRIVVATWSSWRIPTTVSLFSKTGASTIFLSSNHLYSQNLVATVIEPGPRDLWPGTLTTRPQRRSTCYNLFLSLYFSDVVRHVYLMWL